MSNFFKDFLMKSQQPEASSGRIIKMFKINYWKSFTNSFN